MVNMPISLSTYPSDDEITLVTDISQNINHEYYKWLLKQHNYFPECAFYKEKLEDVIKMEHSYTRDYKPRSDATGNVEIISTRTILVERPPLCPSCHQLPPNHDEKVDTPEAFNIPIPPYNEEAGRKALNATEEMIKFSHNRNSDAEDWTQSIQKHTWTEQQVSLFERIERILDMDQLGRLAVSGLPNECLRRNAIIEKSISRMRAALASVHWEPRLTSWVHGLLISSLPPKYMVSYIDILQALKRKIPTLVDKMLYYKQIEMHKEYMSAIMKEPWQPTLLAKKRTLPNNPVIIAISSTVCTANTTSRERRWLELLRSFTNVESIKINLEGVDLRNPIEEITESLVSVTRARIQLIRNQLPNRPIILAGFNASASIALQVALVETINSIVCMGFAFNTLNGTRGAQDDQLLELTTPVLFVVGQNAQRSSQEEIESLRENMAAQTVLVVVGSSDDSLRVKRLNRSMEGVSQSMIDSMILDEIQEFATSCILNPPAPRKPKRLNGTRKVAKHREQVNGNGPSAKRVRLNGDQKLKEDLQPKKGRKIVNGNSTYINDDDDDDDDDDDHDDDDDAALHLAIKSILPEQNEDIVDDTILLSKTVSPITQKVKYIPANQFLHIKPPPRNMQKIYMKQQCGNQTYTLGVKNIGTKDTSVIHNNFINAKSNNITTENQNMERMSNKQATGEQSINDIDIFDIPILFADNDGNIFDENQIPCSKIKKKVDTEVPKTLKSIDIISDEIISNAIVENSFAAEKNDMQSVTVRVMEKSASPPKPVMRSNGKFVLLNKHTLNQLKGLKRAPAAKFRKVNISSPNIRCFNSTGRLSSIDSKPCSINGVKANAARLQDFTHLSTIQTDQPYTNGMSTAQKNGMNCLQETETNDDVTLPKSGILIKRKYMKNITIRKMNIVQSENCDKRKEN